MGKSDLNHSLNRAADELRAAVRASDLTQDEIARRAGVHPVTLSRWMTKREGWERMKPATMDKIARAIQKKIVAQITITQ